MAIVGGALGTCALAPEVLAFPYRQVIGDTTIYSETRLPASFPTTLARGDRLLRASRIYGPGYARRLFLTDGRWRWRMLALSATGAFAISRPLGGTIVLNRSDVAQDVVFNGAAVAGRRTLSGVIAHERTHGLIRARFGILADLVYPEWVREGYCDVVAGGGSLSDEDAARLNAAGGTNPALRYYAARKRVEATLRRNGGSVDRLFADARL